VSKRTIKTDFKGYVAVPVVVNLPLGSGRRQNRPIRFLNGIFVNRFILVYKTSVRFVLLVSAFATVMLALDEALWGQILAIKRHRRCMG
jgi:hypothetical protein